jgi:heme-degrading monooxygenase HmoA
MEQEYDAFAREVSQPMFEEQPGFEGVIFARDADRCLVITWWVDHGSISTLATSAQYKQVVDRISHLLLPDTTTEVYELRGGVLPGRFTLPAAEHVRRS